MKALLIVAHGSRRTESNDEIRSLATKIRSTTNAYNLIECAFLELASPDIHQGGIELAKLGATSIMVFPYFLVAGRHVTSDVPAEVNKIIAAFPNIEISIAPYFGASEGIEDLILGNISGSNGSAVK